MKRILILGTRPEMEQRLERQFKGRAELRFFNDITGSSGIRERASRADVVILNIRLGRHGHQYVLRKAGIPFHYVDGATSAIAATIEKCLQPRQRTA